jgi:calcium/calmodulin-dependent protein kinase (CaM kinase) II
MSSTVEQEVLECQRKLLSSIATCDWATYEQLCACDLTCFEPEAVGHLVEGMAFHKFYFDFLAEVDGYKPPVNTISAPHVSLQTAMV